MSESTPRFVRFCTRALGWVCLALFALLAAANLFYTAYFASSNEDGITEWLLYQRKTSLLFWLGLAAAVALAAALMPLWRRLPTRALVAGVLVCMAALGIWWLFASDMGIGGDPKAVNDAVNRWFSGDYSDLAPNQYLGVYPFQLGFGLLLEGFYHIFGQNNYFGYAFANLAFTCVSFWLLYRIARLLLPADTGHGRAVIALCLGCAAPVFFCVFIYGNTVSTMLALAALWQQLEYQSGRHWGHMLASAVCLALAILFKSFALIFLVAQAILLLLQALQKRNWKPLVWLAVVLVLWQGISLGTNALFRVRSGGPVSQGMPAILWVAMGLQDGLPGSMPAGWYNGYSFTVYQESGWDTDVAAQTGQAYVQARLGELAQHPAQALGFFAGKALSQWTEPTYESFRLAYDPPSDTEPYGRVMNSLFLGAGQRALRVLMSWYQTLVWVCAAGYLTARRRQLSLAQLAPALIILGGFLFQLMWEAKSQYVLPYFLLALPYAAAGFVCLVRLVRRRWPFRAK